MIIERINRTVSEPPPITDITLTLTPHEARAILALMQAAAKGAAWDWRRNLSPARDWRGLVASMAGQLERAGLAKQLTVEL